MQNNKLKILLLDQGRQSLPFLKSFAKSGHHVTVVCNTRLNESYFSRYPSKKLLWPSYINDREGFEIKLFDYLKNNQVDVTISVGDVSADILARNQDFVKQYTRITSPDYDTFLLGADKLNLMMYCMDHGLPCPKTYELTEKTLANLADLLDFPVMVKPLRGIGAIGVKRYDNLDDLKSKYPSMMKEYGQMIVQEFIPQKGGMQYQAEAFVDDNHEMRVCLPILKPRFFPVSGGTSTANVTIEHSEIYETTKKLLEGMNWRGAADVDYILDPRDNIAKILEINPRVTAGIKIGFAAGIDYADLHLKLALGQEVPVIDKYKLGVYCRNFFLETLWFLFSTRQMKKDTKPSFFNFFGRNVVDQLLSFDDPFTGLGFVLNMIRKYSKVSNFKAKVRM
ncbi:MAG: ATP-grasp domain-containing protein [Marinilabiliaceae bacterium]|nr:ATP-grasp domain-containing protein [Marinilabiliaceae bacterium]